MSRLPLSCGYLIKNEETFLEASLESIASSIEELIVLDSGSSDRSLEIAHRFKSRVPRFVCESIEWRDDFAWARNQILDLAQNDFVLFIDGDELLDTTAPPQLARLLENSEACASLIQRNYTTNATIEGATSTSDHPLDSRWSPLFYFENRMERFVKRSSGIRFEGRIHESLLPSTNRLGLVCKESEIVLHHYGRLKAIDFKKKSEYYLELTRRKQAEDPENPTSWLELMVNLMELERFEEAEEIAERALVRFQPTPPALLKTIIQVYLRTARYPEAEVLLRQLQSSPSFLDFSEEQLSTALLYQGKLDPALQQALRVLEKKPMNFVSLVNAAVVYFETKDFKNAARHLLKALQIKPDDAFLKEALNKIPTDLR